MEETKKIAEPNQTEYKMPTKAQTAKPSLWNSPKQGVIPRSTGRDSVCP